MSLVLEALAHHARVRGHAVAVQGGAASLTYHALHRGVQHAADYLRRSGVRVLGLALDNGPAWAVWDLAAQHAGVTMVPVPAFFTPAQRLHVLADAGVQGVIESGDDRSLPVAGCAWRALKPGAVAVPAHTAKVTYTSGTTGRPKGVCLAQCAIDRVVKSLAEAVAAEASDRHLALLPLSVLLENIGGLYVPLYAGATALLEPLASVGVTGSSGLAPARMLAALDDTRATTAITVPAVLEGLVQGLSQGLAAPAGLRYLAVGGATVSPHLLARARALGLPVYQGYGLSECASVVAVNRPGDDDPAAVGRPLGHVHLGLAGDGEVLVHAEGFLGYLGDAAPADPWWSTGDLGRLDEHGRLHIVGRKKDVFITAFGRNVSPGWVEAELTAEAAIAQAAVFGEARPRNVAVLVSSAPDGAIEAAVGRANQRLPDYARVRRWLRAGEPFTPANGLVTGNGRVRRPAVAARYASVIAALFDEETNQEFLP